MGDDRAPLSGREVEQHDVARTRTRCVVEEHATAIGSKGHVERLDDAQVGETFHAPGAHGHRLQGEAEVFIRGDDQDRRAIDRPGHRMDGLQLAGWNQRLG